MTKLIPPNGRICTGLQSLKYILQRWGHSCVLRKDGRYSSSWITSRDLSPQLILSVVGFAVHHAPGGQTAGDVPEEQDAIRVPSWTHTCACERTKRRAGVSPVECRRCPGLYPLTRLAPAAPQGHQSSHLETLSRTFQLELQGQPSPRCYFILESGALLQLSLSRHFTRMWESQAVGQWLRVPGHFWGRWGRPPPWTWSPSACPTWPDSPAFSCEPIRRGGVHVIHVLHHLSEAVCPNFSGGKKFWLAFYSLLNFSTEK